MNHPLFFTPEEAEQELKKYGPRAPSAEAIRTQAQKCPAALGFPVTVLGPRVYIPIRPFRTFWGIPQKGDTE